MILKELLRNDFNVKGDTDRDISYISYNSKDIKASTLFIAISGHKVDGHLFIEEAIKNGAKAIVYELDRFTPADDADTTWIGVNNSRDALAWMSSRFFKKILLKNLK